MTDTRRSPPRRAQQFLTSLTWLTHSQQSRSPHPFTVRGSTRRFCLNAGLGLQSQGYSQRVDYKLRLEVPMGTFKRSRFIHRELGRCNHSVSGCSLRMVQRCLTPLHPGGFASCTEIKETLCHSPVTVGRESLGCWTAYDPRPTSRVSAFHWARRRTVRLWLTVLVTATSPALFLEKMALPKEASQQDLLPEGTS